MFQEAEFMPSGKTHAIINLSLIGIGAILLLKMSSISHALICTGVCTALAGTFFLSPDNDIYSVSIKNWGFFRFIWAPYRALFKHRGISHSFWIGSLSRILYLLILAVLFGIILQFIRVYIGSIRLEALQVVDVEDMGLVFFMARQSVSQFFGYYLAAVVGLIFSDGLHILADRIF